MPAQEDLQRALRAAVAAESSGTNLNEWAAIVDRDGKGGNTACEDHNVAWRVRNLLNLDHLATLAPASGDPTRPDNIVFDITATSGAATSASGYGHPKCANAAGSDKLPVVQE